MKPVKENPDLRAARQGMVSEIEAEAYMARGYLDKETLSPQVLVALGKVPRHLFVPPENRVFAYENRPLPIGAGQTISQPFIVALMSDLADLQPGQRVLEVGTGCGYQAAVLAELGAAVYSIERVPELAARAAESLQEAGYGAVQLRCGDGALGWPEAAPFDAILVTAAAFHRVPPALIEQLAPGGRLVIPVERSRGLLAYAPAQELLLITKTADGSLRDRMVLPVAFVPLIEEEAT